MNWDEEEASSLPPLPSSPPPEPVDPTRITFTLSNESSSPRYEFNNLVTSSSPSYFSYQPYTSPGIYLLPDREQQPYFGADFQTESSISWNSPTSPPPPPMIVEEEMRSGGGTARPVTPRSIANSLDSLSECAQHHHHHSDVVNANSNSDRSRSLGDLLAATMQDGNDDSLRNGSYDTLVTTTTKGGGLTDSGIGGGLLLMKGEDEMDIMDDHNSSSSPDHHRIPTDISSPDSFTYPPVSFTSYDPVNGSGSVPSYSNENTNPLDSTPRGHSADDRKHSDLPAISEESEHEQQSIHIPYNHYPPHSSSVGPGAAPAVREVVEHTYPMVHCNSAPSNTVFNSDRIAHRRVVSDDVTETTRLKRSEELENMDKVGRISFEKRSASTNHLSKSRKGATLVFHNDPNEKDETDDEEEYEDAADGYSKDNEMLILEKSGGEERYRMASVKKKNGSPLRHFDNHSNLTSISSTEPPPVRLPRRVSAVSSTSRSSPQRATDQSWKDKMPPFGIVGHSMYSPQSLPSRDAIPRTPFDGSTISSGASSNIGGSQRQFSHEVTSPDGDETPDSRYSTSSRLYENHSISSPTALLAAELTDDLMPLSEICKNHRLSISSSINTEHSQSPPPKSQSGGAPNSSFVRRSLRKIMKRGSVSTSALGGDEGLRNGSLKRRASNVSSSFFASAQERLRPRAKSLKKQRIGKNAKKEKSGSDTFTFGNLFRKKPPTSRPNLADIISDLDQRSTTGGRGGGSLSAGATNRRSTSATILPMSSAGGCDPTTPFDSACSLDGLPDHISRMVSPSDSPHHATSSSTLNGANSMSSLYVQLDRIYGKHDLFANDEYQSWHEKYRHNTLSTKQVKKQDAIFELYLMEKRHCANIAFLLHGYRRRMLDENIITKQDMDVLIPDVLEPLLIFHLNVLERITARMKENYEVGTISDIISEELAIDGGQHTKLCCDAYTDFGVAKERSDVLYHHLMNKNAKFAEFFKKTYSEETFYKHYDFRPLITKIIGRATKYSLLLETILKNEQPFSEYHDLTKTALETARKFAHKIDGNLSMAHMSMKWEELKAQIDSSSATTLYVSDPSVANATIRYTFDLDSLNSATNRKLVHLGEALIKIPVNPVGSGGGTHSSSSGKQVDKKDQCYIVLFDDIIVILIRKSSRQLIFMQDQGVMPVQSLLIRTAARGHSIMLISGAKPVLFEISFHTSTDRKKWVTLLELAPKNVPPEGIRITTGDADGVLRDRVAAQQDAEDKWLKELEAIFDTRLPEEEALAKYLETRLEFFDNVREHVSNLPFKTRTDISNRIREAVKGRFRELRRARVIPLNRLVERITESRDADLWSYFDEKADAADVLEKSSDLSEDSDNSGDSAARGAKPRRIQTFHGTSQQPGSSNGGGAIESILSENNGIRRHTTVPRMNSDGGSGSSSSAAAAAGSSTTDRIPIPDDVAFDEENISASAQGSARGRGDSELDRKTYGEMLSDLPIRQTMRARRASTNLIKEVISLRKENHLLKNDNALTKSRCALLERVRGGGAMMTSTATAVDDSMEMLRKKEKEIRELQQKVLADRDELAEKQKAIDAQEEEIQTKWAALQARSIEQQQSPMHVRSSSSHSQVSSPTYKTSQTDVTI
ncbi:DH domain-containing protein [Caenorhabditis elegans]|uniref:DH domain-containing protein n=1 Tax=Caenorhabditis elegans TaxID=6239 RepID=A0A0K3AQN0_CAEEL|nr:DH domain-containing protein [Caenorhabditis elegans]CTQ86344.1 DH domain-containing protein [Caenorhabditis elegans]|eukprot:NP_001300405.1 Uncharacterized protein CELE_Y105E8A.25 [Caenorhabditis elegans]